MPLFSSLRSIYFNPLETGRERNILSRLLPSPTNLLRFRCVAQLLSLADFPKPEFVEGLCVQKGDEKREKSGIKRCIMHSFLSLLSAAA